MSAIKLDADNDNNHAPAHGNSSSRKESDEHVSDSLTFRAMVLFQVVAYGSYSVLVHLCERDGTIMFSSTTMNLVLELVKLAFSSYQILSHFKIVSTAILYRLIIKRKLSYRQWFAVTLLFCGSLFYSLGIFFWQHRSNEETVCSA
jgi:drug/metabolite transporter (DMT)-like permease